MFRILLYIISLFFVLISCNKKKETISQETTNSSKLPPIEEGTLDLGDSATFNKNVALYNKKMDEIDSLWTELGVPKKMSDVKRPNLRDLSKKLLDTVSSIQKIIQNEDKGYLVPIKEGLYRENNNIDNGIDFSKIELATEQLRREAVFEAIKNVKEKFELKEDNMLIEQIRKNAGKRSQDAHTIALISANKEQTTQIIAELLQIKPKEVKMMVEIPNSENITTYKEAMRIPKKGVPKKIEEYLKTSNVSKNFRNRMTSHKYRSISNRTNFLTKAKKAKDAFMEKNPLWYSSKQAENYYSNQKLNVIYLPLGELSFADKVISHFQGINDQGDFTQGCIGIPDVIGKSKYKDFFNGTICNIGVKGVLVVEFTDNVLIDVNGPDLYVFEVGKIEPTKLEISKDGQNWINIGKIEGGTAYVDIHDFVQPNDTFNYIRLTDLETYSAVPGADVDAIATIGGALRLSLDSEVLFDTGKYQLKKEGKNAIKELAKQIENLKKGVITIEGHTDNVGEINYNLKLSQKRAKSVSNELKNHLPKNTFQWKEIGYGESRPLVKNDTDENRNKNRRVEILVLPINH